MPNLSFTRCGSGPALVLVHGYLGASAVWADQVTHFSATHDVICPDLPGFGESAHLTAPDSIEGHAQAVLDLLDDLHVATFALLGHSMGGMIVQAMVKLAPHRIKKLVLYGTGPLGVLPGRFETIATSRARLMAEGVAATARRIAATWFLQGEQAEGYALCAAVGQKTSQQAALASLNAWEHWDGRSNLAQIACPTLVLWGSHDKSYAWSQPEALWRGIPGADLAVVPNAAHNVHLEKPLIFNEILADFLA
ncbi:hydrolase [Cypionkella aquatica]|uniref:Hydrolase n=1 Tax=Cypionkella aquatica TaxID=1756042 RepID=A0AA37U5I8_9RHOB|nr:alpha/beta hydrolase [Cypionkella aquatica]GLS87430.1 hydrolase [Cypionkella aquatica]